MYQNIANAAESPRRWFVLAIVITAQFMSAVDAIIVNVALPTIAADLHASAAQIEAVIAIYLIELCDAGDRRWSARRHLRHPSLIPGRCRGIHPDVAVVVHWRGPVRS